MGEIANLIAELRRAASDANWVVMEADAQLMLRAATYLESLSAPVEDEEKVRLVSLALLRATCDHYGDPSPANPDLSLTNILARAAIAALRAPVGVTVTRRELRKLVDHVWNLANEDRSVPATNWADAMIDHVFPSSPKQTSELEEAGNALALGKGSLMK